MVVVNLADVTWTAPAGRLDLADLGWLLLLLVAVNVAVLVGWLLARRNRP